MINRRLCSRRVVQDGRTDKSMSSYVLQVERRAVVDTKIYMSNVVKIGALKLV